MFLIRNSLSTIAGHFLGSSIRARFLRFCCHNWWRRFGLSKPLVNLCRCRRVWLANLALSIGLASWHRRLHLCRWGHGIGPSPIGPSIDPHKVKAIKTTTPQSKCFASKSPSDRTRLENLLVVNLACFGVQRKSGDLNLTSVDCVISLALRCKGPLWPNCLHWSLVRPSDLVQSTRKLLLAAWRAFVSSNSY